MRFISFESSSVTVRFTSFFFAIDLASYNCNSPCNHSRKNSDCHLHFYGSYVVLFKNVLINFSFTHDLFIFSSIKVFTNEGPYPMIIEPPGGRYWIENGQCVSALGEDGIWRAPKISTEHYTIQTDTIANIYGRCFVGQVRNLLFLSLCLSLVTLFLC